MYARLSLFMALALALPLLAPSPASACGGTFCDSGPTAMPVEQTGENILFVVRPGEVEAHIQIQYQGVAERFAWVIPLPAVPDVQIGSQPLFANLLNGSVPSYGFRSTFCNARSTPPPEGGGGQGGLSPDGTVTDKGPPQVVLQKTVGAFEVTVLQGGTAIEVGKWLKDNGYAESPLAPEILNHYVAKNHVFAAIKLTGGAGVEEIHPLVVRFAGDEPCVPLKLTAVAAVDNMGVRAFFLGPGRVVPTNYKHVVLNPARIDWLSFANNYAEVVSRAVDSPIANGRAFVTEYAGPSTVVRSTGVYSSAWKAARFLTLAPQSVMDELSQQGLASCAGAKCTFNHPLLLPLLHKYLPVPTGVDEGAFYSCVGCYQNMIDAAAWDGQKFAVDYQERIVLPGRKASELLVENAYLTRLYTTISPFEMTEDPIFHVRGDLPPVPAQNISDRLVDTRMAMELPNGMRVALTEANQWPSFNTSMPWAARVEEIPVSGAVLKLVDNETLISLLVDESNANQGLAESFCRGPGGSSGGSAGVIGGSGGSGGSSGGSSGKGGTLGSDVGSDAEGGGCGCRIGSASRSGPVAFMLGFLALSILERRRRSRSA